jgi:hypothetical protein
MKNISKIIACLSLLGIGFLFSQILNNDLQKYRPLENAIHKISQHPYDWDKYNCIDFSNDAQRELERFGIKSEVLVVQKNDDKYSHAIIGVWFDAQTGEYADKEYEYVGDHRLIMGIARKN